MVRPLLLALSLLAASATAHAQDADDAGGDRFIIPRDALSPLRRTPGASAPAIRATPVERVPEVLRDPSALSDAARRTRERILAAARAGNIEALRPLLGEGDRATQLAFDALATDPIEFLLAASGDPEGHELLAILIEVLETGFIRVDNEDEGVLFVWPYFAGYPIDALKPEMKVELFRLLTGGDYEEMTEFGAYIFYRVGITENGDWRFFLSGDG